MRNSNWNYPTTVWFGEGRVKDLYLACKNLKIQKPLLVTDKDLGKSDLVKKITNDQNLKKLSINVFSNIKGNPVGSNVVEGVEVFKKGNHDGVIAFGGGSGLDVGKAVAFMSAQTRSIWDFEDVGDNWTKANAEKIAPIIAVPTTAGTGSEAGRASLITNEKNQTKKIIFHPKILPSIVIGSCLTQSSSETAATGMMLWLITQKLTVLLVTPMADGIALEGMNL